MDKTYNMRVNEILFKLSDMYNLEQIYFDNCLGENLFGKLLLHRVENIAYKKLLQMNNIHMGVYKKYFEILYKNTINDITIYEENLVQLCEIMKEAKFKFAFLKGAFLITNVYEKGLRYSNDIDILINEKDIDECQDILLRNGFFQGYVDNGILHKASRKEIVLSRMNYGETIPFCKLNGEKPIYIDLNFSLDYKPTLEPKIIQNMLENSCDISWKNNIIKTLNIADFIIHLCMHLYKEATTLEWVISRRDLNLYKFNDLNVLFHKCVNDKIYNQIYELILRYGVQKECYYALFYTARIYKSLMFQEEYVNLLNSIKLEDLSYLCQIVDPKNKKVYTYNMSFEEWFSCEERIKYLYEI